MRSYKELIVWQRAMDLVIEIYQETTSFPKDELFGLVIQMKRAAVSIPSNIAEGYGRKTTADFIHFLIIARGSLYELETQLEIAKSLNFIAPDKFQPKLDKCLEIEKMLNSLIASLNRKSK